METHPRNFLPSLSEEEPASNLDSENGSSCSTMDGSSRRGESAVLDDAVHKDNRRIALVRGVAILLLLSAAVLTSYFSFRITRDSQIKAFEEAFQSVASKVAPGLVSDLSLRLWQGRTVAASVRTKLRDKNVSAHAHLLEFESEDFTAISEESRLFAGTLLVGWNPLLKTEEDRLEFEEMVASVVASEAPATAGGNAVCHVCGSPTRSISNPDDYITIPGFGPTACGDIESAGLSGFIEEEKCALMGTVLVLGCNCMDGSAMFGDGGSTSSATQIARIEEDTGDLIPMENGTAPYMPHWAVSTAVDIGVLPTMLDQMSLAQTRPAIERMLETRMPMFTETVVRTGPFYEKYEGYLNQTSMTLLFPVEVEDEVVGSVSFNIPWQTMFTSVIPELSDVVHVVIENSLGQNFTFDVDPKKKELVLVGEGDLHEEAFDSVVYSTSYEDFDAITAVAVLNPLKVDVDLHCRYRFHVFAKQELKDIYLNRDPIYYAIVTAAIFVFTSAVFILYDIMVRRVQRKVVASAKHTTAIVSSLFPKNVRDRLLQQAVESSAPNSSDAPLRMSKMRMQSFLVGGSDRNTTSTFNTDPIADLFASATVMFLDIASFTAWSSEREPSQVFVLLETIYQAFDRIAAKLHVFKVETIGDSYVAVCGLPTRREGHAPVMAKFAQRCLVAMQRVTKDLEVRLGPSTGDLQARVGLHSGPVTAGVMRGEKARFQLFGDTVNTASRLESLGLPNHIHVSQSCVDLLEQAGKGRWASKRDKVVSMKGKGELHTYFLKLDQEDVTPSHHGHTAPLSPTSEASAGRLVEFNTEILYEFLKRIVVHRHKRGLPKHRKTLQFAAIKDGSLVVDELTEKLNLPTTARNTSASTANVKIPPEVKRQLHEFVKRIAATYRDVPFHNFEHCSHVLMSTSKLMKRIVNPDGIDYAQTDDLVAIAIHKSTYGISSDPILQFASLFAALIHDVDHTGLTNAELIEGGAPLAATYRNQSVAEQNSVDLAWGMLMEPTFVDLRRCIFSSEDELTHFRQLVVTAVMATDIADKNLKQAREKRWAGTFTADPRAPSESAEGENVLDSQHDRDRKATIVFEYIIQASDVCHTMQHWHTYQKFNIRLFEERYVAWLNGNLEKEPSLGWYFGEIWFFDNYIIPMASKLDKCGVFGVSYQEYLTYAKENRKEWVVKGKEIVEEMKQFCDTKYSGTLEDSNIIIEEGEEEEEE